MTISYGPLRVSCDGGCGTELEAEDLDVTDFYALKQAIEDDEWVTRRVDKKWCHFCPDCG